MNLAQLVQQLRQDGELTLRAVLLTYDGRNPDALGPPGRGPLIEELRGDARLRLDLDMVRLR